MALSFREYYFFVLFLCLSFERSFLLTTMLVAIGRLALALSLDRQVPSFFLRRGGSPSPPGRRPPAGDEGAPEAGALAPPVIGAVGDRPADAALHAHASDGAPCGLRRQRGADIESPFLPIILSQPSTCFKNQDNEMHKTLKSALDDLSCKVTITQGVPRTSAKGEVGPHWARRAHSPPRRRRRHSRSVAYGGRVDILRVGFINPVQDKLGTLLATPACAQYQAV